MSIGNKYLYLRALMSIPLGIFAFQLGFKELNNEIKMTKDSYLKFNGEVHMVTDTTLFDKEIGSYYDASKIVIEDSIYYTRITKFRKILNANLAIEDKVAVYYRRDEGINKIKALYREEEPIIAYKNVYWVGVFFIIFGLVMTLLSIGALLSGLKSLLKDKPESDD
jgi:hypothetical protein